MSIANLRRRASNIPAIPPIIVTGKQIGCLEASKGRSDQKGYIYVAENLSFGEQELDAIEKESDTKIVKLKISEIPALIKNGKITDSHTIASFQLFMLNYKDQGAK